MYGHRMSIKKSYSGMSPQMIWCWAMQKPNRSSNKIKDSPRESCNIYIYISTQRVHYSHKMKTTHHFTRHCASIQMWNVNMKRHEVSFSFGSAFRKLLAATCRKGKGVLVPSAYFHTQSCLSHLQPCHAVQTQASPLSWRPLGKFASHNCSRLSISNIRLSEGSQESVAA